MPFTYNDLNNILAPLKARRELKLNRGRAQQLADIFEEDEQLSARDKARLRAAFDIDYSNVDDVNDMYGDILSGTEERAAARMTALSKQDKQRRENFRAGLPTFLKAFEDISEDDFEENPELKTRVEAAAAYMGIDPNAVMPFIEGHRKRRKSLELGDRLKRKFGMYTGRDEMDDEISALKEAGVIR